MEPVTDSVEPGADLASLKAAALSTRKFGPNHSPALPTEQMQRRPNTSEKITSDESEKEEGELEKEEGELSDGSYSERESRYTRDSSWEGHRSPMPPRRRRRSIMLKERQHRLSPPSFSRSEDSGWSSNPSGYYRDHKRKRSNRYEFSLPADDMIGNHGSAPNHVMHAPSFFSDRPVSSKSNSYYGRPSGPSGATNFHNGQTGSRARSSMGYHRSSSPPPLNQSYTYTRSHSLPSPKNPHGYINDMGIGNGPFIENHTNTPPQINSFPPRFSSYQISPHSAVPPATTATEVEETKELIRQLSELGVTAEYLLQQGISADVITSCFRELGLPLPPSFNAVDGGWKEPLPVRQGMYVIEKEKAVEQLENAGPVDKQKEQNQAENKHKVIEKDMPNVGVPLDTEPYQELSRSEVDAASWHDVPAASQVEEESGEEDMEIDNDDTDSGGIIWDGGQRSLENNNHSTNHSFEPILPKAASAPPTPTLSKAPIGSASISKVMTKRQSLPEQSTVLPEPAVSMTSKPRHNRPTASELNNRPHPLRKTFIPHRNSPYVIDLSDNSDFEDDPAAKYFEGITIANKKASLLREGSQEGDSLTSLTPTIPYSPMGNGTPDGEGERKALAKAKLEAKEREIKRMVELIAKLEKTKKKSKEEGTSESPGVNTPIVDTPVGTPVVPAPHDVTPSETPAKSGDEDMIGDVVVALRAAALNSKTKKRKHGVAEQVDADSVEPSLSVTPSASPAPPVSVPVVRNATGNENVSREETQRLEEYKKALANTQNELTIVKEQLALLVESIKERTDTITELRKRLQQEEELLGAIEAQQRALEEQKRILLKRVLEQGRDVKKAETEIMDRNAEKPNLEKHSKSLRPSIAKFSESVDDDSPMRLFTPSPSPAAQLIHTENINVGTSQGNQKDEDDTRNMEVDVSMPDVNLKKSVNSKRVAKEMAELSRKLEQVKMSHKELLVNNTNFLEKKKARNANGPTSIITPEVRQLPPSFEQLDSFLNNNQKEPEGPEFSGIIKDNSSNDTTISFEGDHTIPLVAIDGYLQPLSNVCVPSDLLIAGMEIPFRRSGIDLLPHEQVSGLRTSKSTSEKSLQFRPYESPLKQFRSFRFNSRYLNHVGPDGYNSLTYSHKLDPYRILCMFEINGGTCNDSSCTSQHFKDFELTGDEVIMDMASYKEGDSPDLRKVYSDNLRKILKKQRQLKNTDVKTLTNKIVQFRAEFLHDNTRTVCFNSRGKMSIWSKDKSDRRPKRRSDPNDDLPNKIPIKATTSPSNTLQKILAAESRGRYYESSHREDEEYNRLLKEDEQNVEMWMEFAVSSLPSLLYSDYTNSELNLKKPLNILSQALQKNPRSENLWEFYLDLYLRHDAEKHVRETMEKALEYLPSSRNIWGKWIAWEKDHVAKEKVLVKMIEVAASANASFDDSQITAEVSSSRSHFLLDAILSLIRFYIENGVAQDAKSRMYAFLTSKNIKDTVGLPSLFTSSFRNNPENDDNIFTLEETVLFNLLDKNDLAIAWLSHIYFLVYGTIPSVLTTDFIGVDNKAKAPFLIVWPDMHDSVNGKIINDIFSSLVESWLTFVEYPTRQPYIAILRNFIGFLKAADRAVDRESSEVQEIIEAARQAHMHFPEIWDLSAELEQQYGNPKEAEKIYAQSIDFVKYETAHWNRIAKFYVSLKHKQGLIDCLVAAARTWFNTDKAVITLEDAFKLYRRMLRLEVGSDSATPPFRKDIDQKDLRVNVFVWLNYILLWSLSENQPVSLPSSSLSLPPPTVRELIELASHAVKDQESLSLLMSE